MAYNVLIADDDKEIREVLHIYLRNEGYRVLEAGDGAEALEKLRTEKVDLVVLDLMMPRMDGIAACLSIRESSGIPIIMLSAKGEDLDKITGLSIGADDYVTKPFNPLELMARVKAQLRRQTYAATAATGSGGAGASGGSAVAEEPGEIRIGELTINKHRHEVTVRGEEAKLTPIEFAILELLAGSRGHVFGIDKIYQAVWKDQSAYYSENTVVVHIRNIREKIEPNPREPQFIKTVWGVGYKIDK